MALFSSKAFKPFSIMGSRKGKGLKAALTSQQSRFKAKKKLLDGAKVSEERLRRTVSSSARHIAQEPSLPGQTFRSKKVQRPFQKPTIPFKPTNHILLVGEGNFSFARALIDDPPEGLAPLSPQNITATGYDTEEECYVKHPASRLAVSFLRDCGVEIIFGVDATRLEKHASLKGKRWDRIVWNFPHAGASVMFSNKYNFLNSRQGKVSLTKIGMFCPISCSFLVSFDRLLKCSELVQYSLLQDQPEKK